MRGCSSNLGIGSLGALLHTCRLSAQLSALSAGIVFRHRATEYSSFAAWFTQEYLTTGAASSGYLNAVRALGEPHSLFVSTMLFKLPVIVAFTSALVLACPSPPENKNATFAADSSINAAAILNAAKSSKSDIVATFPSATGPKVNIFGDWLNLGNLSAVHWIADMQVDCDGPDFKCKGNTDGQPQTSFGHLDARKVPWIVAPDQFQKHHLPPNALAAVICNKKMFYAMVGDTNGDTPETIGEASELLAQTCFPKDGLNGGKGHNNRDVLYIAFTHQVPPGVGDETIDIEELKSLGDKTVKKLAAALGV